MLVPDRQVGMTNTDPLDAYQDFIRPWRVQLDGHQFEISLWLACDSSSDFNHGLPCRYEPAVFPIPSSGSPISDGYGLWPAYEVCRGALWVAREVKRLQTWQQLFQEDLHLQPGQVLPEADMGTEAET
jgi:hypothetical protein